MNIIVAVTFSEGDDVEQDVEHYGPFAGSAEANHFADQFEAWFATLNGDRRLVGILITPLMPPTMLGLVLPECAS